MLDIKLDRPIAFFDIESTGISPRADRIIELCIIKIHPDKSQENYTKRFHPERSIPAESSAIHGIYDADVTDCPTFTQKAHEVADFLEGCDLAGYNIGRFDIPMLTEEFGRAGMKFRIDTRRVIDMQRIYHRKEPRDLSAALRFYCGEEHTNAHGAEADVIATIKVFEGQLKKYDDLPHDIDKLDDFCNQGKPNWVDRTGRLQWLNGQVAINFGKNKDRLLKDLIEKDPGFIKWMLRSDFPPDTREIIEKAQAGTWPQKP